jgi:hypothetical protein
MMLLACSCPMTESALHWVHIKPLRYYYKSGKLKSEELLIFSEAQVELQYYDVTTLQHTCVAQLN